MFTSFPRQRFSPPPADVTAAVGHRTRLRLFYKLADSEFRNGKEGDGAAVYESATTRPMNVSGARLHKHLATSNTPPSNHHRPLYNNGTSAAFLRPRNYVRMEAKKFAEANVIHGFLLVFFLFFLPSLLGCNVCELSDPAEIFLHTLIRAVRTRSSRRMLF